MARKETMAERKYCKMKKDIHPEYRPVVFMDTTTGYKFLSGSTKRSNETVEFEGETYPLIRVEISSDSHPFSLDVKSSLKQMDAWIVSTKNTVSNNQPHLLLKNVDTKPFPRNWIWLFLFLVPFLVPSWKTNLLHYPGNLQIL